MNATTLIPVTEKIFSYSEFKEFMNQQLTHPSDYNAEQLENIKLNVHRVKRNEKTVKLPPEAIATFSNLRSNYTWLVIVEPWCGDGAQILPVLNMITEAAAGKIRLQIILRDKNPDVIERFLTNGTRSIPKVICSSNESQKILWTWGPRPTYIKGLADAFKTENPGYTHDELVYNIHKWYAADNGRSIIKDLIDIHRKNSVIDFSDDLSHRNS